ncbi:MAG: Gfo/Idh/MocA family oxidoreductase [Verrucomicrobia bacterium]|nr:Gfo/Idh/MocA family oxidoreductase [Verrucomicrobiota bacterium]
MNHLTRRSFLKSSLLTTAALSAPARFWAAVPGANDDIRIAVVGFGGRGGNHISAFRNMPGVRLVALCDCDTKILENTAAQLEKKDIVVKTYTDIRKLLESKEVDAISTATPNHWHSLITVWSCQAGKDVYVEKPVSHNVFEGRQCVEAARKYNRIVQAGTQSRSMPTYPEAWAWIREGHIGKIKIARGLCYKPRQSIGKVDGPQAIPANIDYDLWCGPALKLPLMRKKLHYDWHWVWNTGSGDMGNQGIHEMDKARWALGKMELPASVFSIGGRLGYVDDGETANTQMCVFDYGDALLIFETRGLPRSKEFQEKEWNKNMDKYRSEGIGQMIECEGGSTNGHVAWDKDGKQLKKFAGSREENHFANFITAVRSRKKDDLKADILEGHLSSALCHLGNISHRVGKLADPDELHAALKKDAAAQETLARMEEHLAANGVDIKQTKLTLGPTLKIDPKTERFIGHAKANELITRPYRPGFVVPEKV